MKNILVNIIILSSLLALSNAFVPASLMTNVIFTIDTLLGGKFGKVSDSLPHEEITRRGIIQSAVLFFYNQTNGSTLVDLTKIDNEYYTLSKLYYDYYGRSVCSPALENLLTFTFQPNVARVDFSSSTKDLPYAHFDAEEFVKSNDLVIDMITQINTAISTDDYTTARSLSGQVLHTIQDFYSHSNHVEMGLTEINKNIGTTGFNVSQPIITENETNACLANCNLVSEECNGFVSILSYLLGLIGYSSSITACPLTYYNCSNNINILDKLLSGYYSGQSLTDGTPVNKPTDVIKCSHGGILDASSTIPATGGINKDSGFLVFSPHALLHIQAATLATKHTEYFFDQIRLNIGNAKFDTFLDLTVDAATLSTLPTTYTCSVPKLYVGQSLLVFLNIITLVLNKLN